LGLVLTIGFYRKGKKDFSKVSLPGLFQAQFHFMEVLPGCIYNELIF